MALAVIQMMRLTATAGPSPADVAAAFADGGPPAAAAASLAGTVGGLMRDEGLCYFALRRYPEALDVLREYLAVGVGLGTASCICSIDCMPSSLGVAPQLLTGMRPERTPYAPCCRTYPPGVPVLPFCSSSQSNPRVPDEERFMVGQVLAEAKRRMQGGGAAGGGAEEGPGQGRGGQGETDED